MKYLESDPSVLEGHLRRSGSFHVAHDLEVYFHSVRVRAAAMSEALPCEHRGEAFRKAGGGAGTFVGSLNSKQGDAAGTAVGINARNPTANKTTLARQYYSKGNKRP